MEDARRADAPKSSINPRSLRQYYVEATTPRASPMATRQLSDVLHSLRHVVVPAEESTLSDGQLLTRYLQGGAPSAFAALVHRHGPMVWGACRRVLRRPQD